MAHGPAFWLPAIVQPIGTVFIGIAGFFIARRQWQTANEKYRYELFEKRFTLYRSVQHSLTSMMREGETNIDIGPINSLNLVIDEVNLFFGSTISDPITKATIAASQLRLIAKRSDEQRMRQETIELQSKLFITIVDAGTDTLNEMRRFIDFSASGKPPKSLAHAMRDLAYPIKVRLYRR